MVRTPSIIICCWLVFAGCSSDDSAAGDEAADSTPQLQPLERVVSCPDPSGDLVGSADAETPDGGRLDLKAVQLSANDNTLRVQAMTEDDLSDDSNSWSFSVALRDVVTGRTAVIWVGSIDATLAFNEPGSPTLSEADESGETWPVLVDGSRISTDIPLSELLGKVQVVEAIASLRSGEDTSGFSSTADNDTFESWASPPADLCPNEIQANSEEEMADFLLSSQYSGAPGFGPLVLGDIPTSTTAPATTQPPTTTTTPPSTEQVPVDPDCEGASGCAFDNLIDFNALRAELANELRGRGITLLDEDVDCDSQTPSPNRVPIGGRIACVVDYSITGDLTVFDVTVTGPGTYTWEQADV